MRRARAFLKRFRKDRRGAAALEFALVAGPLCLTLLALTDLAYRVYVTAVVEGTVHRAARLATVGDKKGSDIDDYVREQLSRFTSSEIQISKTNYYEFSGIGKSEKLVTDTPPLGIWNIGDCYEDLDDDGQWDPVAGRDGLGSSDDIVYYRISFTYPRLVPLGILLGWSNEQTVEANTVMRNQPFASQAAPAISCT